MWPGPPAPARFTTDRRHCCI